MLGTRYVVQKGDTLSGLAARFLGEAAKWPLIYEHNNQPNVVAATGARLVDPDLILVGQTLFIPQQTDPHTPGTRGPAGHAVGTRQGAGTGKGKARPIAPPPFKYNLSDLRSIKVASPGFVATVRLTGSVTIQSNASLDFGSFSQSGVELSAKKEADTVLGKLASETKVGWNPDTGEMTFETGFTIHSDSQYAPTVGLTSGVSTETGLPVIKGTVSCPPLRGTLGGHLYMTHDLGAEIELTPRPPSPKPRPAPRPNPEPAPRQSPSAWEYLAAGALIVGAGALVVATVAEDIATLGAGVADDPASFAAASAMVAGGVTLVQGRRVEGGTPFEVEDPPHL